MEDQGPWASTRLLADETVAGRWQGVVDEIWVAALVPLGGLTAAVAAGAMTAELAARHPQTNGQRLRSIHCTFAAPVPHGPTEADVQVIRAGRSLSQAQVVVHAPGAATGLHALAAFGAPRTGYRFLGSTPPLNLPPPEACRSFREPPPPEAGWEGRPRLQIWDQVIEGRSAIGLPPWDRSERTTAEAASWYRFDQLPMGDDAMLDPAGLFVLGDLMLGSVGQRIGYTERPWFGPSVDLTMHLFAPAPAGWILSHNRCHVADDGYASVETHLWDMHAEAGPVLLAYATQQMFFSFPDGPPDPGDLAR